MRIIQFSKFWPISLEINRYLFYHKVVAKTLIHILNVSYLTFELNTIIT